MTSKEVHNMICMSTPEQKMDIAIQCQLKGLDIKELEESIATLSTAIEGSIQKATEIYKYLNEYIV